MWLFDSSLKSTLCLYIILIFAILLFLISLVILTRRREGKVQEKFPVARPNQLLVSELLQKYRSRSNQPSIVFYEILSDETTGRHLIWVIMKKCGNTQPFASIEYYEGMDPVLIPVAKDISEEFFRQGMRADLIPCYGQPDTRENLTPRDRQKTRRCSSGGFSFYYFYGVTTDFILSLELFYQDFISVWYGKWIIRLKIILMNKQSAKSRFRTLIPIKEIMPANITFLEILRKIAVGEINEGIIAKLPNEEGNLYIDHFKISNIIQKHGDIPLENMIITANEPTLVIMGIIEGRPYITLAYEFISGGFVLSARKFNGHYVVTFFESSDTSYIESIKNRGEILFDKKKTP